MQNNVICLFITFQNRQQLDPSSDACSRSRVHLRDVGRMCLGSRDLGSDPSVRLQQQNVWNVRIRIRNEKTIRQRIRVLEAYPLGRHQHARCRGCLNCRLMTSLTIW